MGKGNVVPFKVEHLKQMDIKELEKRFIDPEAYKVMEGEHSCTLLVDGVPVICAGIVLITTGVGEVWTITDKIADRYPILLHKTVLQLLKKLDDLGFHRLQSICSMWGNTFKWLEKLGFEYEGTMRQFGPNKEDYCLYGRIK